MDNVKASSNKIIYTFKTMLKILSWIVIILFLTATLSSLDNLTNKVSDLTNQVSEQTNRVSDLTDTVSKLENKIQHLDDLISDEEQKKLDQDTGSIKNNY